MPHLIWTEPALEDLDRLFLHLAKHSLESASSAIDTVTSEVSTLAKYPSSGRQAGNDETRREWVIDFGRGAYIVFYEVSKDGVYILSVRHGRESVIHRHS